jgi:hypothetical protein
VLVKLNLKLIVRIVRLNLMPTDTVGSNHHWRFTEPDQRIVELNQYNFEQLSQLDLDILGCSIEPIKQFA